jgi:hypothetical protein
MKAQRGRKGIALLFLEPCAKWRGWSTPRPDRFTTQYPFYRRLGGPYGRSVNLRKISPALVFDLRTVEPVASRYNDYAIQTQ